MGNQPNKLGICRENEIIASSNSTNKNPLGFPKDQSSPNWQTLSRPLVTHFQDCKRKNQITRKDVLTMNRLLDDLNRAFKMLQPKLCLLCKEPLHGKSVHGAHEQCVDKVLEEMSLLNDEMKDENNGNCQ